MVDLKNGTVKWFDKTKGFGFISPKEGGKDVFLHITALEAQLGVANIDDGTQVKYTAKAGIDGRLSVETLELAPVEKTEPKPAVRPQGVADIGIAKWFNATKGFGFIMTGRRQDGKTEEAFLHISTLQACGLTAEQVPDGTVVEVFTGPGQKPGQVAIEWLAVFGKAPIGAETAPADDADAEAAAAALADKPARKRSKKKPQPRIDKQTDDDVTTDAAGPAPTPEPVAADPVQADEATADVVDEPADVKDEHQPVDPALEAADDQTPADAETANGYDVKEAAALLAEQFGADKVKVGDGPVKVGA